MIKKACGILETPHNFFIDHLAPLCSILNIPILSSNVQTKFLFQNYYPDTHFLLKKWSLSYLLENFSTVLYSFVPIPSFRTMILEEQKKNPGESIWFNPIKFVYHFHGCSDKGYNSTWIEPDGHFKDLDLLLLYGKRMRAILEDKQLLQLPKETAYVGNYRYIYYQKHRKFFDERVEKDIFSRFTRNKPILFYAPTWEDHENSSSFFHIPINQFRKLAHNFNLVIKLHPNMTYKINGYDPSKVLKRIEQISKIPHVLMLPFYPLIYPLLNRSDIFLFDYSSVGYDSLVFNKPLFFINSNQRKLNNKDSLLFKCGTVIDTTNLDKLHSIIEKASPTVQNRHLSFQKQIVQFAFGEEQTYEKLKKTLFSSVLKSS